MPYWFNKGQQKALTERQGDLCADGGGSHRSLVENGQIQIRVEDPLPQDENVLDSKPIHGFTAQTMVPMFKEKFQTIFAKD
ncbi:unnamed protein product [Alternaria alternata]|nr:hypothetical protein AALT_g439 [Alternaria alternata]